MRAAADLYDRLRDRYDGTLPFKRICQDHGITVIKTPMDEGVYGFFIQVSSHYIVLVNSRQTRSERECASWHEIYHIVAGGKPTFDRVLGKREEQNADLFAALCLIPVLRDGDTPDTLIEKYGVPRQIAAMRIKFEDKKAAA